MVLATTRIGREREDKESMGNIRDFGEGKFETQSNP
jgi:hypothetical protein